MNRMSAGILILLFFANSWGISFAFSQEPGIIPGKDPNPAILPFPPAVCPRAILLKSENGHFYFSYDGKSDKLNRTPGVQLVDPDSKQGNQNKTYTEMDGKNVLLLKKVVVRYDYEDSAIVDYDGPNPLTDKKELIREEENGFYANFHYALFPYQPGVSKLDRQSLLHLSEGKLDEIDKKHLRPILRTHSFIPGPFLSKHQTFYTMCEWGDTSHYAPEQTVEYQDMALWDWDYSVKNSDHLWLVVWEGDEEDWLIQKKLIPPFYLTDDLIGLFEIKKTQTTKPLTLKNKKGDFEITVQTGDLEHRPF